MYVCDTHALIFYMADELPEKLNAIFKSAENQQNVIFVPSIVIAEALHLRERGKVEFDVKIMFSRLEASSNYFSIAPLDENILKLLPSIRTSEIHDKIIVATALFYNSKLITKDPEIVESEQVETMW